MREWQDSVAFLQSVTAKSHEVSPRCMPSPGRWRPGQGGQPGRRSFDVLLAGFCDGFREGGSWQKSLDTMELLKIKTLGCAEELVACVFTWMI